MNSQRGHIAVACSGGGRSLTNFLSQEGAEAYRVAGVIVSNARCGAARIACRHSIPLFAAPAEELCAGAALSRWLLALGIEWIALAGYLRRFPVVTPLGPGRVINIHPSLLPRHGGPGMYGDRVHRAVLAAQDARSGATVHAVDERYDHGRVIAQAAVPVEPGDSPTTLAARVFAAECQLYPATLSALITGQGALQ